MDNIESTIKGSFKIKPPKLFMGELKWRYLVRSVLRGKNVLLLGPAGQGKTFAVQCVVDALSEIIEEEVTEERLNELKSDENISVIKIENIK